MCRGLKGEFVVLWGGWGLRLHPRCYIEYRGATGLLLNTLLSVIVRQGCAGRLILHQPPFVSLKLLIYISVLAVRQFSCLKLGQQKLQNITQRCWKEINTPSEAPAISLMPDRRVGWFSWGPPRFLISSITSSESPLEWKDLLRWARRPEGDGPEVPVGGSGPPDQ